MLVRQITNSECGEYSLAIELATFKAVFHFNHASYAFFDVEDPDHEIPRGDAILIFATACAEDFMLLGKLEAALDYRNFPKEFHALPTYIKRSTAFKEFLEDLEQVVTEHARRRTHC